MYIVFAFIMKLSIKKKFLFFKIIYVFKKNKKSI